jgi:hypothetical protein
MERKFIGSNKKAANLGRLCFGTYLSIRAYLVAGGGFEPPIPLSGIMRLLEIGKGPNQS